MLYYIDNLYPLHIFLVCQRSRSHIYHNWINKRMKGKYIIIILKDILYKYLMHTISFQRFQKSILVINILGKYNLII